MKTYYLATDGSSESFHDATTPAAELYGIADALRADASKLDKMADALQKEDKEPTGATKWRYDGSYITAEVTVDT